MACRDCKWWDYVTADVGWCEWAVKNMPRWVVSQLERTEVLMISEGGEGCPTFKERTDGE